MPTTLSTTDPYPLFHALANEGSTFMHIHPVYAVLIIVFLLILLLHPKR